MNLKILKSFYSFRKFLQYTDAVTYLFPNANLFLALFLESLRLNKYWFSFKNPTLGPVPRKVQVTFRARKAVCVCRIYIQDRGFNNFENHAMKLSVNEAKLTGLWARNCATIQQVSILKFAFGPEKFPGLSRNLAQVYYLALVRMRNQP